MPHGSFRSQVSRLAGVLLVGVIVCACGSKNSGQSGRDLSGGFTDAGSLAVEQTLTIGEETGTIFGRVGAVVADGRGRVFVSDVENTHIRSPAGDSLITFGRKGEGPGEFTLLYYLFMTDHFLAVPDPRQHRATFFSLKSGFSVRSTFSIPRPDLTHMFGPVGADTSGLLVQYAESNRKIETNGLSVLTNHQVGWVDTLGRLIRDSILVVRGHQSLAQRQGDSRFFTVAPFARGPAFVYGGKHIYYGRTDSLRVEKYNMKGEKVDEIRIPYDYIPVRPEEIDSIAAGRSERARRLVLNADLPDTRPAFADLEVDGRGRLWIRVVDEPNNGRAVWKIVNFDARSVRTAELSENISIRSIRGDRIYAVQAGEYGVQSVVVYSIKSPQV